MDRLLFVVNGVWKGTLAALVLHNGQQVKRNHYNGRQSQPHIPGQAGTRLDSGGV